MKKKIFLGLVVVFLAIQAVRPAKNQSAPVAFAGKDDITALYPPSAEVRQILQKSCYDCHSNRTEYPWYAEVEPVGWWLGNHIKEGKKELNFSEFGTYSAKRKVKKLEAICDEVKDRGMPLTSYTLIHRSAKLSDAQIAAMCQWSESIQDKIAEK